MTYKIKHIIRLNQKLLEHENVNLNIENQNYIFRIEEVKTTQMQLTKYFKHEEIKGKLGPVEEKLMEITYGKPYSQMENWQYAKSFTEFSVKINEDKEKLEIKGIGDIAVKVNLNINFNTIDREETTLARKLKILILDEYKTLISINKEKLDELKENDIKKDKENEKLLNEIQEEEKQRQK